MELSFKEIDFVKMTTEKILEINNIKVAFSEWWDVFNSRFHTLNGCYRCNTEECKKLKTIKIPIISEEDMHNLGL
jgi:hypothetical protein